MAWGGATASVFACLPFHIMTTGVLAVRLNAFRIRRDVAHTPDYNADALVLNASNEAEVAILPMVFHEPGGAHVEVRTPDEQIIRFYLPESHKPGDTFNVKYVPRDRLPQSLNVQPPEALPPRSRSNRTSKDEKKKEMQCCCKKTPCSRDDFESAVVIEERCCRAATVGQCAKLQHFKIPLSAKGFDKSSCAMNCPPREGQRSETYRWGRHQGCYYECNPPFELYDTEKDCKVCQRGRDPSTQCRTCLPGFDEENFCETCKLGFDEKTQCTTCLEGFDKSDPTCNTCVAGRDIETLCRTCIEGRDPQANCERCVSGWWQDPATKECITCPRLGQDPSKKCERCYPNMKDECTACIGQNFDPVAHPPCSRCKLGFDPQSSCTKCLPGRKMNAKKSDCSQCRPGFDPMVDCQRCKQGFNPDSECQTCLHGWGQTSDGSCVATTKWTSNIIGDTHGDENYLVHALLSTDRFTFCSHDPRDNRLCWRTDQKDDNTFEVVILGDVVDRGQLSVRNLKRIRWLAATDPLGRLTMLLGNHESFILSHLLQHAGGEEYAWKDALRGRNEYDLIMWLTSLPVARHSHGTLMMHGGFSYDNLRDIGPHNCKERGPSCGRAVVGVLNAQSHEYHWAVRECMDAQLLLGEEPTICARTEVVKCPASLFGKANDGSDGALWYRAYSQSPTFVNCWDAWTTADWTGSDAHVVAHTAHPYITMYCHDGPDARPVFATDTHTEDCARTGECSYQDFKQYHKDGKINRFARQVPQSLRITQFLNRSTKSGKQYEQCLPVINLLAGGVRSLVLQCTKLTL